MRDRVVERAAVRFVICDDDPIILEAFQEQLEAGLTLFGPDVQVKTCLTSQEALALADDTLPDMLLIDLYICEERFAGIQILETFAKRWPSAKRVALTAHGSRLNKSELRRLVACRLDGFLDKGLGVDKTLGACYEIWRGKTILAPHFGSLLASLPEEPATKSLSERELSILVLRARGEQKSAIARSLGITDSAVATYIKRIAKKLGTDSVSGFQSWCRQHGIAI